MKLPLLLGLLMSAVTAFSADVNITNVTKATTVSTNDYVLGLLSGTTSRLFKVSALLSSNNIVDGLGYVPGTGSATLTPAITNQWRSDATNAATGLLAGATNTWKSDATNAAIGIVAASTMSNNITLYAENYGVKHDGRVVLGNCTTGTNWVSVTTGTMTTNDVGSYVRVRFGISTNQDLVDTIIGVSNSTSFVLGRQCTNSVTASSICIAKTDDYAALQSAVTDLIARGGGTLECAPGIYWLSAPISISLYTDVTWGPELHIRGNEGLMFLQYGNGGDGRVPANTTVFWSGQEVGNGGALLVSAAGYCRPVLENILFRTGSNPNGTAVSAGLAKGLITRMCSWDTGGFWEHDSRIPYPTHLSIAVAYPISGNFGGGTTKLEGGVIGGGFFNGMTFGEHANTYGLAVINCVNAIAPRNCSISTFDNLVVEGCLAAVSGTNDQYGSRIIINSLRMEPSVGNNWWVNAMTIANDPANMLIATITGQLAGKTNIGAAHVDLTDIDYNTAKVVRTYKGTLTSSTITGSVVTATSGFYGDAKHLTGVDWVTNHQPNVVFDTIVATNVTVWSTNVFSVPWIRLSVSQTNAPTPTAIGTNNGILWSSNTILYWSYSADGVTSNAPVKLAP